METTVVNHLQARAMGFLGTPEYSMPGIVSGTTHAVSNTRHRKQQDWAIG